MNKETVSSASKLIDSIIESAGKRFETFGFRKTTVDEISRDLKISKRTLYMVFPSKDAILREVAWRDTETVIREFNDSIPAGTPVERILLDLCRFLFTDRLKRGRTGRFKGLFSTDQDISGAYRAAVSRVISALYREGTVRGALKPVNPDLAAELILSLALIATGKFHLFPKPAAVFTDTLSMIADAIAWKARIPFDSMG
jgi:AcrR family transcriptional regulator